MAAQKAIRIPTIAPVPDSLRIPSSTKVLFKLLGRLSRGSLVDLALEWLEEDNQTTCAPYLARTRNLEEEVDEDYLWTPAETIEELRLTYNRMRNRNVPSKRSIVERMLDGDWRRGLSLYQVAMIDFHCISQHDSALRWTALKLVARHEKYGVHQEPLKKKMKKDPSPYPFISPTTFLRNLQEEIAPLVKAHYSLHRLKRHQTTLPIIRICVAESPYANPQYSGQSPSLFTEPSRLIFIALPDSCPYIYVSVSGTAGDLSSSRKRSLSARADIASLKQTILEEIPKAFSKSQHRYSLESTSLTARSLSAMVALRGHSGTNAANGIYTIFRNGVVDSCPMNADHLSFGQKILAASWEQKGREASQSLSEPLSNTRQAVERVTALAERSANLSLTQRSSSYASGLELRVLATARFGVTGLQKPILGLGTRVLSTTNAGLDRLQIRLDEDLCTHMEQQFPHPDDNGNRHDTEALGQYDPSTPTEAHPPLQTSGLITLTFLGSDVFLGLRRLLESGAIEPGKMPSWMTGEEAISRGTIKHGTITCGKGGGA